MADYYLEKHKFYLSLSTSEILIEEPQLEYDDSALELAGDEVLDATTPDLASSSELLNDDDDFERVLGTAHQLVHAQDVVNTEFADMAQSGVIQVNGDDVISRRVVLFSASRLPSNTVDKAHDRLLRYAKATLDTFVTNEYAIVYLHHGLTRENRPSFGWLRKAYHELDRKYKKNLKALYIVHPTGWIRIFWTVVKPFISSKFARKVVYVNLLSDLANYVDLSRLEIPTVVRAYDQELSRAQKTKSGANATETAARSDLGSYSRQTSSLTVQQLKSMNSGRVILPIVEDTIAYIRRYGLAVEGLFRRSPALSDVRAVQGRYRRGERVDFAKVNDGVNVAAACLKAFLRELAEPLLTYELFEEAIHIGSICDMSLQTNGTIGKSQIRASQEFICCKLPIENYEVLQYLFYFLREVADNANLNQMNAANLAIVFGPNLLWSPGPLQSSQSLVFIRPINAFVQLLITEANAIFVRGYRKI